MYEGFGIIRFMILYINVSFDRFLVRFFSVIEVRFTITRINLLSRRRSINDLDVFGGTLRDVIDM